MSAESQSQGKSGRLLRNDERALLRKLLASEGELLSEIDATTVDDSSDGGMGSLRFCGAEHRSFGRTLAEAEYVDEDGVLVSIAVHSDASGRLFELDFWKVDFSPLKAYPTPERVKIRPIGTRPR